MLPPVSVFLICKNEAARISVTLLAVRDVADEIIVVDSGSTDGSQETARGFGAKVIERHWAGYGPQKRYAEDQCKNNWVLNLDCDEELSPELAGEIRALFSKGEPPCDAYTFPIREILPEIGYAGLLGYTVSPVRLYRRDKGRYADSLVHDRVVMIAGSKVGALRGQANHYSFHNISQLARKLNEYSDLQVSDMLLRGRRVASYRIWTEFPFAFVKSYLFRRHFMRGTQGLIVAVNYAFYRFIRIAKALERRESKIEAPSVASSDQIELNKIESRIALESGHEISSHPRAANAEAHQDVPQQPEAKEWFFRHVKWNRIVAFTLGYDQRVPMWLWRNMSVDDRRQFPPHQQQPERQLPQP